MPKPWASTKDLELVVPTANAWRSARTVTLINRRVLKKSKEAATTAGSGTGFGCRHEARREPNRTKDGRDKARDAARQRDIDAKERPAHSPGQVTAKGMPSSRSLRNIRSAMLEVS